MNPQSDDGDVPRAQLEQAVATAREEHRDDICTTTLAPISRKRHKAADLVRKPGAVHEIGRIRPFGGRTASPDLGF